MDVTATLIEIVAFDPVANANVVARVTNRNDPRATTANGVEWLPILSTAPSVGTSVFNGAFTGAGNIDLGDFVITLADGLGDAFTRLAWSGADIKIYAGNMQGGNFPLVFRAVGDGATRRGRLELSVALSTRESLLDVNLLTQSYAGTGNLEGDVGLKGTMKPWVLGAARFCRPVLLDPVRQIWQASAYGPVEAITNVFEGGQEIPNGSDFAGTLNDFLTGAGPAQGSWTRMKQYGLFRLGSQPLYQITCHVKGDTGAVVNGTALTKVGDIIGRILSLTTTMTVKASSLATLNANVAQPFDDYFEAQVTVTEVLTNFLLSVGGYYTFDESGNLIFGLVRFGQAVLNLDGMNRTEPAVMGINALPTSAPVWYLRLGAEQCHFVHDASNLPAVIANQGTAIATAQATADAKNKTFPASSTPPAGAIDGDQWPDTSVSPQTMRRYSSTSGTWVATSNQITTANQVPYASGTTIEALKPAQINSDKTSSNTASGIAGQGAFATINTAGYGSSLLTGFGSLSPLSSLNFGSQYLLEGATGGVQATLSNFKTLLGIAASISGQGAFATVSSAGYGSSLLTGFGQLSPLSTLNFGSSYLLEAATGGVQATLANFKTLLGTASSISGQGGLATKSTISFSDSATLTGVPSNIATLTGAEGINNTMITVSPTGALNGIGTGSGTPVANLQAAYAPRKGWGYPTTAEGWTAAGATLAWNSTGTVTITATSTDPNFLSPNFNLPGRQLRYIRIRARPLSANSGWDGTVYYTTPGHGIAAGYAKSIPAPVLQVGVWQVIEWDMGALSAGGDDYVTSTIYNLRIDLASSQSDWEVDWVALGDYAVDPVGVRGITDNADQTVANTAAAITGQTIFATLASGTSLDNAAFGLPTRLSSFGGFLSADQMQYQGGPAVVSVGSLRPGEVGSNVTETRTASAISGQGAFATVSTAGYGSALLTGFGALAPLGAINLGSNYLKQSNGTTLVTDATAITSLGTASAISGQGALATKASVAYGSTFVTGFSTLASMSSVYFGSAFVTETSGGAQATLANFKTISGTAAGITGQGGLATVSSISGDTQLSGVMANRLSGYSGDTNYLRADRMAWSEGSTVQAFKPAEGGANITENRTAASITGQGYGATAPTARVDNTYNALGVNAQIDSAFSRLNATWVAGASNVPGVRLDFNRADYSGKRSVAYLWSPNAATTAMSADAYGLGPYNSGGALDKMLKYALPVKAGDNVGVRALVANHRCNATLFLLLFKADGSLGIAPSTTVGSAPGGGANGDGFGTMQFTYQIANPDVVAAQLMIRMTGTGETAPYIFFSEPWIGKLAVGQTTIPPYSPGLADPTSDQTGTNTAAGFTGQGAFATVNTVPYGSTLLTGFGSLASRSKINLGSPSDGTAYIANQTDSYVVTDALAITSQGTASAISGQGALATKGSVSFAGGEVTERFASNMFYGTTAVTSVQSLKPAEVGSNVTGTNTAAAISGQGGLATVSTISADSQLSGAMGNRLAGYSGDTNYLRADRMAWAEGSTVQLYKPAEGGANITESRTAAAITNQGFGATAAQALVDNRSVPVGTNKVVNSSFARGTFGFFNQPNVTFGVDYPGYGGVNGQRHVVYARYTGTLPSGGSTEAIYTRSTWNGSGTAEDLRTYGLAVKPGQRVYFGALTGCHRCTGNLFALCFDASGGMVFAPTVTLVSNGGGANADPTTMQKAESYFDVPTKAATGSGTEIAYVALLFRMNGVGQADSFIFMMEPKLGIMQPGQTTIPDYVDGPADPVSDKTGTNTAAAISGQGAFATVSTIAQSNVASYFNFNSFSLNYSITRSDGVSTVTEALAITSQGVSSGFSGQGSLATMNTVGTGNIAANAVTVPGYMTVDSGGSLGSFTSSWQDFDTATSGGGGTGGGGTGGGGGGACTTYDTMVLMADNSHTGPGNEVEAGSIAPGDWLWTAHEHTGIWAAYQVLSAERRFRPTFKVYARDLPAAFEGAHVRDFIATADHPYGGAPWKLVEDIGEFDGHDWVIAFQIDDAHTLITNGVLSHNKLVTQQP